MNKVNYALYEEATGEIIQTGDMDQASWENYLPHGEGLAKLAVAAGEQWKIRGEFVDPETARYMFRVAGGELVEKEGYAERIEELKLPGDGE